jgi:hypothetical protein
MARAFCLSDAFEGQGASRNATAFGFSSLQADIVVRQTLARRTSYL